MLLKNEQAVSFWRDFLHIVPRRVAIAFYTLFFEPRSLAAFSYVFRNRRAILAQREEIQRRGRVSASEIRRWLA
jgi:hypothetical protein